MIKIKKLKLAYDICIILLSVTTIVILIMESSASLSPGEAEIYNNIDTSILIIFSVDYFIRLFISRNKWNFIKSNVPDLLSIMPFSQVFQALRAVRIFRLLRLVKLTKLSRLGRAARVFAVFTKLGSRLSEFFRTNNFIYVIYITGAAVLFGAIGISAAENMSFDDAIWWSIVTTTTVGYGDISPSTLLGRLIAIILMIIGIGFLGMLTGTISTYFIKRVHRNEENASASNCIVDTNGLCEEDLRSVVSYIDYLKNKNR